MGMPGRRVLQSGWVLATVLIAVPERSGDSMTASRCRVIGHVPIRVFEGDQKTSVSSDEQFDLHTER
jgi:hypothetical protein